MVDYPSGENNEAALGALYLTRDGKAAAAVRDPRLRHRLSAPVPHIPTRFIHAEALPLSANGKTDRHRIRADLSHQQTAPALNACAAPPPNAPVARSAEILTIYWQAIGVTPRRNGEETAFIAMGLKLPHIKQVAARPQ